MKEMSELDEWKQAAGVEAGLRREYVAKTALLVKALEFIRDGYDNHDVNHVDYRVKVYQVALDALDAVSTSSEAK